MKFEGEVGEIELISRLVEMGREKFTGALRFENDAIIKIIYFKEGDILSASTNDRTDSIDEILLKAAKVTREHLKQALSKRKESETLGDALLNLGFITRKELTWARRVQVIGIIRSIQQWTAGSYTLVADYLPKREEGTIFNLAQIVLELLLTETDRARLDPTIASGEAVFKRTADFDRFYPELGLNQEADTILTTVDGERNASEVVEASSSDAFNVYKLLQALEYLGLIERSKAKVTHELSGHTEQIEWDEPLPPLPSSTEPAATLAVPLYQPEPIPAFELDEDDRPLTKTLAVSEHDYISEAAIVPPEPGVRPGHSKPMFGQVAVKQKRSSLPLIALIVLLCGGAAYGAYWYLHRNAEEPAQVATVQNPKPRPGAATPTATPTSSSVSTDTAAATTTSGSIPTGSVGSPLTTSSGGPASTTSTAASQQQVSTSTVPPVSQPVSKPVSRTPLPPPAQTAAVVTAPAPVKRPAPVTASKPLPPPPAVTSASQTRPSPPPVTIATAAPSSDLKQKYDALARSYENQMSSTAFTLQVELVCRPESITKAIDAGGSSVWFVPISYKGGSCYRVFWGKYASRAEAERAGGQIPAILRESKPVVVSPRALREN